MDMHLFEENKPWVLEALQEGDFDYIDSVGEVFETEFFAFINAQKKNSCSDFSTWILLSMRR